MFRIRLSFMIFHVLDSCDYVILRSLICALLISGFNWIDLGVFFLPNIISIQGLICDLYISSIMYLCLVRFRKFSPLTKKHYEYK